MKNELERYFTEGYYNWGVQLLRQLGHDGRDVARFEKHCSSDFAPMSLISDMNTLLRGYYDRLPKQRISEDIEENDSKSSLISELEEELEDKNLLISRLEDDLETSDLLISELEKKKDKRQKKDEPLIITNLRQEERQLRNDRRALHATLDETFDDAERGEKCVSIRALTGRIDQIWTAIFAFEKDGTLPALGAIAEEKTAAEEAVELTLRQLTLRPRLTRLKKMLADPNLAVSKKIRYEREQSEKEAELEIINHKLMTIKGK
jgi:hypothetical protein